MGYSIKVNYGMDSVIDVSGDDYPTVMRLFNKVVERFAPLHKSASLKETKAKLIDVKNRHRL